MTEQIKKGGRILSGVVVGTSPQTVKVEVVRLVKHRRYGKYQRRSKRYLAHDPAGRATLGQEVRIRETRPVSRRKHFIVL